MNFVKEYLRFDGRLNRKPYWLGMLALIIILILCGVVSVGLARASAPIFGTALFLASILFFIIASMGITVRRLHDRNKSGWWIIPFQFLPNGLLNFAETSPDPLMVTTMGTVGLLLAIWGFIEIGILKGTAGPNQFGEDPLNN